ncbi:MAG TPA: hypothetical protein VFF73_01780 [Planctomycetota bacterium]|nr:hypothetical protein [Planctomycetota bacterium]
MTQATLAPRSTTTAPAPETILPSYPGEAPAEKGAIAAFLDRARRDPWILPKIVVLALVATPQMFAIATVAASESPGILVAVVPDMVATILVAWGMIGCLLFLDDASENGVNA